MAAAPASARQRPLGGRLAAVLLAGCLAGGLVGCNDPAAGTSSPGASADGAAAVAGASAAPGGDAVAAASATPGGDAVAADPVVAPADASTVLFDPGIDVRPEPLAGPDLGDDTFEPIDEESVVPSPWGLIPNDRLWFLLPEGAGEADAAVVAERMQGTLGGRIEVADLWLVLIPPQSPDGMLLALDFAGQLPGVDAVLPDAPVAEQVDCAPELSDPVYAGDLADPYNLVGVSKAWQTWFAAGVKKSPVHVGIVDTALTDDPSGKIGWEFDNVTWVGDPVTVKAYETDPDTKKPTSDGFHHADGVLGIIAGDRTDGGIAGIASPMGGNLMVSHADFRNPPTRTSDDSDAEFDWGGRLGYTSTLLLDVKRQVESGATIINLSVGTPGNGPEYKGQAEMWRRFYAKMAREHPDVLFVAAAGNNTSIVDGHNSGPGGIAAPNLITVGSVQTDETITSYSNEATPYATDGEVTLFAPGDQAVWGTGRDGKVLHSYGGTSSATPMVTATAALIRSMNPKLTAAQIKSLILETTRESGTAMAQILQVDAAVRKAVDMARSDATLVAITDAEIAGVMCDLDVAGHIVEMISSPPAARWLVEAVVPGAVGTTGITLTAGGARPANWRQSVAAETERVEWNVLVPKGGLVITVTRLDNGFWKQYRLRDGLDASPTPAPTAKPTPKPTKKPKPTAKPSTGGFDCSKPPPSGSIASLNWSLHCQGIAP